MTISNNQINRLKEYFQHQPEVAAVYLYGSQAKHSSGPLSDVDLGVLLQPNVPVIDYLKFQLTYIGRVETILKTDLATDLKILHREQTLVYLAQVINQGQLIVVNNQSHLESFINYVSTMYPDFYPVLDAYYQAMHQRLEQGTYAA